MRSKSPQNLPIGFIIFALFVLSFISCRKDQSVARMPERIGAYVYGYTSGIISNADHIRVRFAGQVATPDQVGQEVPERVIRFSPNIAGTAYWEDEQTLRFEPDAPLPSGTAYVATVSLSSLFDNLPEDVTELQFQFHTRNQYFEVNTEGLFPPNLQVLNEQALRGELITSDVAEPETVEELLSAQQSGRSLPITWQHDELRHTFIIENISRGEQPGEVSLTWNGKPLGIALKGEEKIEVPALGDFKLSRAQVVSGEDKYVRLHFSDPLQAEQSLEGLITLANYKGDLRFIIEGNTVRVYPTERLVGPHRLMLSPGIRNINGKRMPQAGTYEIVFEDVMPQVRLVGNGVILPESEGLLFPFEAIGLHAVEVEIFKIYNNNILQFLQTNDLNGLYDLQRVGRVIRQQRVDLDRLSSQSDPSQWKRYALDLKALFQQDDDAIYQIRIGFRPAYSTYFCAGQNRQAQEKALTTAESPFNDQGEIQSIMESWQGIEGPYPEFRWEHREDPCYPAYYNSDRFVQRNVIVSNLGIMAKGGEDGSYFMVVTDLRTAEPVADVKITFYDYQQQNIGQATTGADGMTRYSFERKPFVAVATRGEDKGYLKMEDGNALSLSRFDISGERSQRGLKAYLYADRGVWRPGDSVYLNFILEDRQDQLPPNYPVQFELYDPRGQLHIRRSTANNTGMIYPLYFETRPESPTGNWLAKVMAGGATFQKVLKIETVKPNRLKIDLSIADKDMLRSSDEPLSVELQSEWLHGAPAGGLEAKVEVMLRPRTTTFDKYRDYVFDDPARRFDDEPRLVYDGKLNSEGRASFTAQLTNTKLLPGFLTANFKTRVTEKGGDFSTDNVSIPYSPFPVYTGILIPENKYGEKRLDLDKKENINLIAVDESGTPLANRNLKVGLYQVNWRWWWDEGEDNVSRYNSSNHYEAIQTANVQTNRSGEAEWSVELTDWGRYLVRVCDAENGHCAGEYFTAGYPWYGDDEQGREVAAMLTFTSDKTEYAVGEEVSLQIPSAEAGRALITIENGSRVLTSFWKDAKSGDNTFTFRTTEEMTPNVYAHVSLIQPHGQRNNDLPIRMYGVIPIQVDDPDTHLQPELKIPDVLRPEQEVTLEVSEADGRPMAYTLALVDEGLLSLTRFQTPDPWQSFYAREALGVQTWDLYDQVLGAYGGELERVLSIGGDGEVVVNPDANNANRFKPVVMHLGPFQLPKGRTAKHTVTIPSYVGAVRAMLVAANDGAYGSDQQTVTVRKPLMVLATLPRVLGPGETLDVPVNVFAMEDQVKQVQITVEEVGGLAQWTNGRSQSIRFDRPGDQLVRFPVRMAERTGVTKFVIRAEAGKETARQEIEIEVRNPNPYVTDVVRKTLEAGEQWSPTVRLPGMAGTNTVTLEVSSMPPINLGERLRYLLQYPYGCIEQTISGGFPQLYVGKLMELPENERDRIPRRVEATIERVKLFQTDQGGFAYWPGQSDPDPWASSYTGHFLLEAKAMGYTVPASLIDRWLNFQRKAARSWRPTSGLPGNMSTRAHEMMQSYRLYTLALAGKAELGAMNRLRETQDLALTARWNLAAAYAQAGKPEVARSITKGQSRQVDDYTELSYTYGSGLRDRAMILETLTLIDDREGAAEMVIDLSESLSREQWLSTQTTAYCLLAIGKYAEKMQLDKELSFAYQLPGKQPVNAGSSQAVMLIDLPAADLGDRTVQLSNKGKGAIFARLVVSGQPVVGAETAASNNLNMTVTYKDLQGKSIDPGRLAQGTDFIAEVQIRHPGTRSIPYQEMALDQIFPSGWEIVNTRMENVQFTNPVSQAEYQDFRDDRVYTFFDILPGQTHVYRVQLNAAYEGRYYLPAVSCQAMYDNTINARTAGRWVEVAGPSTI